MDSWGHDLRCSHPVPMWPRGRPGLALNLISGPSCPWPLAPVSRRSGLPSGTVVTPTRCLGLLCGPVPGQLVTQLGDRSHPGPRAPPTPGLSGPSAQHPQAPTSGLSRTERTAPRRGPHRCALRSWRLGVPCLWGRSSCTRIPAPVREDLPWGAFVRHLRCFRDQHW